MSRWTAAPDVDRLADPLPIYATALMNCMTIARFRLDHRAQTARVDSSFCRESVGGSVTDGVHAQIEPALFAFTDIPCTDAALLPGHELRLMGHPFNTHVVYTIVSEVPR